MLAARHEYSAVRRALGGMLVQFLVIVSAARLLGLVGVASGMLIASILLLWVDLHFVHKRVTAIDAGRTVVAPLSAALLIGTVLALIDYDAVLTRIGVAIGGWVLALVILRLIPRDELQLLRRIALQRKAEPAAKE